MRSRNADERLRASSVVTEITVNLLRCIALACLTIMWCSGCSWFGWGEDDDLRLAKVASRPINCINSSDCARKWDKAKAWVRSHTEYRLRQVTDVLITTEHPPPGDPMSAFEVVRIPKNDGTYMITFDAFCGDEQHCEPTLLQHKADFVRSLLDEP